MENNIGFLYKNDNKSQISTLTIKTNKNYYYKGETVEGNIILDSFSCFNLSEITISLFLKENWVIQETSTTKYGEKNTQLLTKFDLGVDKFLNNKNEIKAIQPGSYSFPFKLELPNYLQPSFEYPMPNRTSYLRYLLESEIISNDLKLKTNIYILIKDFNFQN